MKKYLYFAYGANIDEFQFKKRCSNTEFISVIKLDNYEFQLDNSGVATIISRKNSYVEGVLWCIDTHDLLNLDKFEGVDYGFYKRGYVKIHLDNKELSALCYFSLNKEACYPPYSGYMESIIKSAKNLNFSKEYIEWLKTWV